MELLELFKESFLEDPQGTYKLAEEYGLADALKEELEHPLLIALCRKDINAFAEYVIIDPETNDNAEQQPFHREWQEKIDTSSRILIGAPRGHGKCLLAGTKLYKSDGSRVKVETIPIGEEFETPSWVQTSGFTYKKARVWRSTVQEGYEIRTKSGRVTRYSGEHPCYTGRGWVDTKDVKPGDTFAVARNLPGGTVGYCPYRAWLLGFLLGDGGLTIPSRIRFTCTYPKLKVYLPKLVEQCGFKLRQWTPDEYVITSGATQWIRKLGLNGCSSHTKFIPEEVFTWNNSAVEKLIAGYFDSDGCVSVQSKVVEFSSVNQSLLSDVQSLLLRFGIISSLRRKNGLYNGKRHQSWRLQINGSSLPRFAQIVGETSDKGSRLQELVCSLVTSKDNLDLIPEEVLQRLQVRRGCRSDKKDGCDLSNKRIRGHLRSKVQLLASKQQRIDLYYEADLFWDEVIEVIPLGPQQTYSVEVDETHVHITDDFITHNTVQIVVRIIWALGHNPNTRIKIISSSDEKAKEILGLAKEMIEESTEVKEIFPHLKIDKKRGDTKGAFFVHRNIAQRDPSVEAAGVLSGGAGGRSDLLICDDVVDMKNAVVNPALREQVTRIVKETWFSLVAATGKIVWICTPYHIADASHDLKNTGGGIWDTWWIPAIQYHIQYDEDGVPVTDDEGKPVVIKSILWPGKWDETALDKKRIEVGDRVFARQFLLNAMSDEERTFPDDSLIKSYAYEIADIGEIEGGQRIPANWPTYAGVDLGAALGKKNSWTVIVTIARSPHNSRLYIKEIWRRRVPFSKVIEAISTQFKSHLWRRVNVENNAYQQAVVDSLDDTDRSIPVQGFTTGAYNKANEQIGLPGLNVAIEKGNFAFPAARFPLPSDEISPYSIFWEEITTHPGGEFTDTVMALWFAYRASLEDVSAYEDTYIEALET